MTEYTIRVILFLYVMTGILWWWVGVDARKREHNLYRRHPRHWAFGLVDVTLWPVCFMYDVYRAMRKF